MTTVPVCDIRDWTQLNVNPAPPNGKRVVVAMSGGVDSSVAALMLHEQGYEVIGVMLRLWAGEQGVVDERTGFVHNRCCTPDAVEDAHALCDAIGAPFFLKNLEEPFREAVVEPFIEAYLHGKTPNPCLHCNRTVRFTHLLNIARGLGAEYLATGHYARVVRGDDGLYHLYTRQYGMPLANKPESQEICFIATGDYRQFLRRHAPPGALEPGPIIHVDGRELGRHEGLPFYTLGQRRGLGIPWHEPLYVVAKDHTRNALIVGHGDECLGGGLIV